MADKLNDKDASDWVKFTTKTWKVYQPGSRGEEDKKHPAKFPEKLAADYIEFFTQRGDRVFDPFCGTGTTIDVAAKLGREAVGVELNEEYARIAQEKLDDGMPAEVVHADSREWLEIAKSGVPFPDPMDYDPAPFTADFVFTSPPYWDVLGKSRGGADTRHKQREAEGLDTNYGENSEDLGNIEGYGTFIDELVGFFEDMRDVVSPGGYVAIVSQNVRAEDGEVRPIAYDLGARLREAYALKGERLWLQDDKMSAIWGWPTEYTSGKAHHIINILKKRKVDDVR